MPAKYIKRTNEEKTILHIFNRGVSNELIFKDQEDCEIFRSYLEEYLSDPASLKIDKKAFVINGKTYKGIPHLPKNYNGSIELLAYHISPNSFHLVLFQVTRGSIQKFMRSLCTRYSMYFNKKYNRTGPLFDGTYKSIRVTDGNLLLNVTGHLHRHLKSDSNPFAHECSSFEEYVGSRNTPWIRPERVLALFNSSDNKYLEQFGSYQNFVEKYDHEILKSYLPQWSLNVVGFDQISNIYQPEKRGSPTPKLSNQNGSPKYAFMQIVVAAVVFLLLLGLGFRNIKVSSAKKVISQPIPSPAVSGVSDTATEVVKETETAEEGDVKLILEVETGNGSSIVNIRKFPIVQSDEIGETKDGETFEIVSREKDWYGILMPDGTTGFINERYVIVLEDAKDADTKTINI